MGRFGGRVRLVQYKVQWRGAEVACLQMLALVAKVGRWGAGLKVLWLGYPSLSTGSLAWLEEMSASGALTPITRSLL